MGALIMTKHHQQIFNREVNTKFEEYVEKRDGGDPELHECSDDHLMMLAVDDAEASYDDYCDSKYEESKEKD